MKSLRLFSLKSIIVLFFSAISIQNSAQQLPLFSLFEWNRFTLNPAYAAAQDSSAVRITYRNQWSGFSNAPKTFSAGGFGQFGQRNGFSGFVLHDQSGGAYSQTAMQIAFSRYLAIKEKYRVSAGIGGWLNQYSFDNSIMLLNQPTDPSFPAGTQRSLVPDISAGLLLQTNKFSIGLGGHQLLRTSMKEFNLTSASANRLARHYFVNASYKLAINENLAFVPAAMIKSTDATDFQTDVQLVAQFRNFLSVGLNYRLKESPAFIFQIQRNKFQLGYSYDMPGGALQNYQNGSHEIALGYTLRGKNDFVDTDKDGVADKKDKCPNVVGPIENKGCPWGDSDGDGMTDNIDKCPNTKGPIENNGCPWSDTDGDGLTDNIDKCPNEKGEPLNGGCPDKDSDGDGIVDRLDSCPMTKAANTTDGCPVLTEVQKKAIDQAITNLEFETGKAIILSSSYSALDMLAVMLNDKTDWNLALEGHTDDVGEEAANLLLSQQRANAVATYLISKGIASDRIDVKFFGEQKPIASNETEEGRKANRRVAMRFVFK